MPSPSSFDYAIVRVVPWVERGEFLNAGIIVFCRTRRYLAARVELDHQRLDCLFPGLDHAMIQQHLDTIPLICQGGPEAGPIGRLSQAERFYWLVAPRSTIIQVSPAHSGLCSNPAAELDHLVETLVRVPPST